MTEIVGLQCILGKEPAPSKNAGRSAAYRALSTSKAQQSDLFLIDVSDWGIFLTSLPNAEFFI
jgi:hypothetical protein